MANQVIFKRAAWKRNKSWPDGWEPYVGRKAYVTTVDSIEKAQRICKQHNDARKNRGETFCEFTAESNY